MNRHTRAGLAGLGLAALFLIMLAQNAAASCGRGGSESPAVRQPRTMRLLPGSEHRRPQSHEGLADFGRLVSEAE